MRPAVPDVQSLHGVEVSRAGPGEPRVYTNSAFARARRNHRELHRELPRGGHRDVFSPGARGTTGDLEPAPRRASAPRTRTGDCTRPAPTPPSTCPRTALEVDASTDEFVDQHANLIIRLVRPGEVVGAHGWNLSGVRDGEVVLPNDDHPRALVVVPFERVPERRRAEERRRHLSPGSSFHGGMMNTRWFSDMAQSWMSVNLGPGPGSGRSTTFSTAPSVDLRHLDADGRGLRETPRVQRSVARIALRVRGETHGKLGPEREHPAGLERGRIEFYGRAPFAQRQERPAWNIGAVFPGLVGNRPRLAKRSSACVHAPRTATPASMPARSCATYRSVGPFERRRRRRRLRRVGSRNTRRRRRTSARTGARRRGRDRVRRGRRCR